MKKIITLFAFLLISFGFAQVPSYVPSNGLIGWWPFNGNANDESGNGNNGTVNGATLTMDRLGNLNSSFSFIANSYINLGNSINVFNSDYSISVWFNADTITNQQDSANQIISKYFHFEPSKSDFFISLSAGNSILHTGNGTNINICNFNNDNHWHNLIVINSSNISSLFLDGQLMASAQLNINSSSNNTNLIIGCVDPSGPLFNKQQFYGKLDDIGIWNRALSVSEVQQLYSGQLSTKETSKSLDVKYYPNPAENILTLSSDETISKVLVYNTAGQLVLVKDFNSKSVSLDMSQLTAGNYFLKVEGKSKTNEFKIIKK